MGYKSSTNSRSSARKLIIPFACLIPLSPNTLLYWVLPLAWLQEQHHSGKPFAGGLLILFSGIFDVLDGGVARAKDRITPFGGVLDSVCDRYSDGIVFLGIIAGAVNGRLVLPPILQIEVWLWAGYALIGSFLVSYTRARAESAGCRKLSVGIAERTERMLILAFGGLSGFLGWALVLIAVFSHITIIQESPAGKKIY